MNKIKLNSNNLVLIVMTVANIALIALVWMLLSNKPPKPPKEMLPPPNFVDVLQRELNLTPDQKQKMEKIKFRQMDESMAMWDKISKNKQSLMQEFLKENSDTHVINTKIAENAMVQKEMEKLFLMHFREIYKLCDQKQKEKLKEVLSETMREPHFPK